MGFENSPSYPSGHATGGVVWATQLSTTFPSRRDELVARGRQIGFGRTLAAMYRPGVIAAGQRLDEEVACRLLADSTFRAT